MVPGFTPLNIKSDIGFLPEHRKKTKRGEMNYSEQRTNMETYLSTNQLMQMLNISRSTVYRLIDRGLPAIKVGAINRFPKDQVLKWFEN